MKVLLPNEMQSEPIFEKKEFGSMDDFFRWLTKEAETGIQIKRVKVEAIVIKRCYTEADVPDDFYERLKREGWGHESAEAP